MPADGWKKAAQRNGTDVTAPVTAPPSRRTLVEMAVGCITSRNKGRLPDECLKMSEDELIERAMNYQAHELLAKSFDPDFHTPKSFDDFP